MKEKFSRHLRAEVQLVVKQTVFAEAHRAGSPLEWVWTDVQALLEALSYSNEKGDKQGLVMLLVKRQTGFMG